jgi:hypothetical protein
MASLNRSRPFEDLQFGLDRQMGVSDTNQGHWISDGRLGFSCGVAVAPLLALIRAVKLGLWGSQCDGEWRKMAGQRSSSLPRVRWTR